MNDPMAPSRPSGGQPDLQVRGSPPAGGPDPVSQAAGQAMAVVGEAADKASSLVGQVKDKALDAVEGQKAGLADQLDSLAESVHRSGEQLQGQQDWIAGVVERGATELSELATSLRENDLSALLGQVKTFARREPAVFIGAMFAAGFGLARFGKVVAADVSRDDLPTLLEVGHEQR